MGSRGRRRAIATAAVALAGLAACGGQARGQAFGQASGFTEFIFNYSTRTGDTTGTIAVGGDLTTSGGFSIDNYANQSYLAVVGGKFTGQSSSVGMSSHPGAVYVAKDLNYNNPSFFGNVSVNGNVSLTNYGTINGNLTYHGTYSNPHVNVSGLVTQSPGPIASPIDFSATASMLRNLSKAQYSAKDPTVNYDAGGGNHLTFAASGPGTSYFNVNGAVLGGSYGITISGTANETVVINVSGTNDTMPNVGYSLTGGITVNHVLFNFYEATSLSVTSEEGNILAPLAAVTAPSGQINGELIAASLIGGVETHVYDGGGTSGQLTPFDGTLRPVPEPASLALMGVGGLGLAGYSWRRRRKA